MAIDTENKRRSVIGYTHPAIVLPLPDGTISQLDRQHVCGIYSGIAAAAAAVAAGYLIGTPDVVHHLATPGVVAHLGTPDVVHHLGVPKVNDED